MIQYPNRDLALFQFPSAPPAYQPWWLNDVLDRLARALQGTVRTSEAAPSVLLLSPSAKVFRVTVSDTGVLTATEVPQGDAGA
jgi:hypothetical protein